MSRRSMEGPNKRPKKITYGDQIVRSEYNDGVLRNNNRANNRLSREMQMYEKAQKVVLKDIGKETQLLRAKLSMTTIASPRLTLAKNTTAVIEPFTVYGMSANPTAKKEPSRKVQLKPIYPSVIEQTATPRNTFNIRPSFVGSGVTPRDGPKNTKNTVRSFQSVQTDSRNTFLGSRDGLVDSSRSALLDSRVDMTPSRSSLNNSRNSGVRLSALRSSGKLVPQKSSKTVNPVQTAKNVNSLRSDSEMSMVETRGGRVSVVSDVRSRQNPSRLSFIEILAEAEERKAKKAKLESETNFATTPSLQPNTSLVTIENVNTIPNPDVIGYDRSRRGSRVGVTPTATSVTVAQE